MGIVLTENKCLPMNDKCIELLVETEKTYKLINRLIKDYIVESRTPCNVKQIIILHFIKKIGCSASPYEIHDNMESMHTNNHYNLQGLIKNGYLEQRNGKDIGMDNRCVFVYMTSKGNDLYKSICDYTSKKIDLLKEELGWEEDDFTEYFADLTALQEFFGGQ
jgi:DNA-binding MarR family transcriptional regulator